MKVKRMTRLGLLTAVALILYVVEAQIPTPLPGVKPGLANIVTVYAMFAYGRRDTLIILVLRILLGNLLTGQAVSLLFSACGGGACYLAMLILRRFLEEDQVWICSCLSAAAHVLGQMGAAVAVTGTAAVLGYLPLLLFCAIVTGLFTGVCAQCVLRRIRKP